MGQAGKIGSRDVDRLSNGSNICCLAHSGWCRDYRRIYGLGLFGVGFFLNGMAGLDLTQSSQTTLIVFLASFIPIWLGTGAVTRVLGFSLPIYMANQEKFDGRISAWRLPIYL